VTPGSSALVLGDQRLRAETISRLTPAVGYCVCLAACTTHLTTHAFDEVFTLSTAFMLGGATTVLGSLWRLKDAGTAIFMFMIHHHLGRGLRPVDALRRAQTWMLDEGRRVPASMPPALREAITGVDLTDPVTWAGVVHQGW
jgi:CHAT domain-containing protein